MENLFSSTVNRLEEILTKHEQNLVACYQATQAACEEQLIVVLGLRLQIKINPGIWAKEKDISKLRGLDNLEGNLPTNL